MTPVVLATCAERFGVAFVLMVLATALCLRASRTLHGLHSMLLLLVLPGVGLAWALPSQSHLPLALVPVLQGVALLPACLVWPVRALRDGAPGLTRAAAGLGAGPAARLRLVWIPLLRGPGLLAMSVLLVCTVVLAGFAPGR